MAALSDEERMELEATAKEWNTAMPPLEVQARWVHIDDHEVYLSLN